MLVLVIYNKNKFILIEKSLRISTKESVDIQLTNQSDNK
jgi:hypothetical protein